MIIVDTLLWGGLQFILTRIVEAVEAQLDDETSLKEELLAAQMRVELGEMSDQEFADFERDILARLREIRAEREGGPVTVGGDTRVSGIEASVWGEEEQEEVEQSLPLTPRDEDAGGSRARRGRKR